MALHLMQKPSHVVLAPGLLHLQPYPRTTACRDSSKPPAPRLTRACLTVLRLLHERGLGESSPFHSYLSVLPQDHRLPLEWTEAELGLLQVRRFTCIFYNTDFSFLFTLFVGRSPGLCLGRV